MAQFHFHAKSEHTIDAQRYDFEMHSVHLPEDGVNKDDYFGAVMGLIFDTQKYDQSITREEIDIIDAFFDSLKWNELSIDASGTQVKKKSLEYVNYGQLMNIAKT